MIEHWSDALLLERYRKAWQFGPASLAREYTAEVLRRKLLLP
jgi:hypothetical protein